jgi:hypothetical protein
MSRSPLPDDREKPFQMTQTEIDQTRKFIIGFQKTQRHAAYQSV